MRAWNIWVLTVGRLSFVTFVLARLQPVNRAHLDVSITQGRVRGYYVPRPPHFQFFGIPYARPIARDDRFKAPKPPPKWDGIFEATHKIQCPQANVGGDENCLVVNVFTARRSPLQPVIVIVHDGYFQSGWGKYKAPEIFLREGFVVVTINYRLGALGFLCLSTEDAPGNAGLKDQVAALYWIQRNIEAFGGSPNNITVYGLGSGAASAQILIMSGVVTDLIHRVIAESGSILTPSYMTYDPIATALSGAVFLGYNGTDDPNELYEFYIQLKVTDIVTIPDIFLPCIENGQIINNSIISSDPIHILKVAEFNKVPMLLAFSEKDSVALVKKSIGRLDKVPQNLENLLPVNLEFDDDLVKAKVGSIVKDYYFGDMVSNEDLIQGYTNYVHDIFTEYPILKFAMLYSSKDIPVAYVMKFMVEDDGRTLEDVKYASTGTVLQYLERDVQDIDEHEVVNKVMTLWKNFITLGDPTPLISTVVPLIWPPVMQDPSEMATPTAPILMFHDKSLKISRSHQRVLFWENVYSKFYKPFGLDERTVDSDYEE